MKKITIILICLYLIHVLFSDQLFDFTTLFKGEYIFKLDETLKSSLALSYIFFSAGIMF